MPTHLDVLCGHYRDVLVHNQKALETDRRFLAYSDDPGVYLVYAVTYRYPNWVQWVLSLNPIAVYISLFRVAFMTTYRQDSPGNAPYNAHMCSTFLANQGHFIPGTLTQNYAWLASCHAVVTNNALWIAAIAWAVVFFGGGIVFFWRAEHLYGRG